MDCSWIKTSPSVYKGITIINQLNNTKFEQFLKRIVSKIKIQEIEIFSEEEQEKLLKIFKTDQESLDLAIKTIIFIFKRMLKFVFMPKDLKNDLITIGFSQEKTDMIVKIWSSETKTTLDDLGLESIENNNGSIDFSWKVNAEISSDYSKKSKVPKAYLLLSRESEDTEIEMTHPELYSMFLQFESIQNELDNLDI